MRIKDEEDTSIGDQFKNRFNEYINQYQDIIYTGTDIPDLKEVRGKLVIIDFSTKFEA